MQRRDRTGGSPRDETGGSIDSHGAAGNPSPSRVIRAVAGERCAGAIPPYQILRVAAGRDRSGSMACCSITAGLQQDFSTECNSQSTQNDVELADVCTDRERRLPLSTEVQQNIHTVTDTGSVVCVCMCACVKPRMPEPIPGYQHYGAETSIKRHIIAIWMTSPAVRR